MPENAAVEDGAAVAAPAYIPSGDACLAFLEGAVPPSTDGKTNTMNIEAGLQAAVAVDGAVLLRYLLGMLLSTRPDYKLQVSLAPNDVLDLIGLKGAN